MECFGSRRRLPLVLLLLHAFLFLQPVLSGDEADLLGGINSFRQSAGVPALAKHEKAGCVAGEIADKLDGKSCATNSASSLQSQLVSEYPGVLSKCKVDVNTTTDGMILPVCVLHRVNTLVLTNYTQSQNARYLNDSRFTGVGLGTEDDWTVVVLATSTHGGSFASRAHRCLTMAYSTLYAPCFFSMMFLVFLY